MTSVCTRSKAKKQQTLKQKCESLYQSVADRKLDKATLYLNAGANCEYIHRGECSYLQTTLHAAIPTYEEEETATHLSILDLLINHVLCNNSNGVFLAEDAYGYTPFELAVADGKESTFEKLLTYLMKNHKPQFIYKIINRTQQKSENKPIQLATKSENIAIVRALCRLKNGIRPNVGHRNDNKNNSIHIAIQRRIPRILYELVQIATISDLQIKNGDGQNAMQLAVCTYEKALIEPKSQLTAWQCQEIIKARLSHNLSKQWQNIKHQKEPTHNEIMAFWNLNEEKNPNCNALKPPLITEQWMDVKMITEQRYRKISFHEACGLQFQNPKFITTHRGELRTDERWIKTQTLSPFAKQLKSLIAHKSANNMNNMKKKVNALSCAVFQYKGDWITVEAVNGELDTELTAQDRITFYEHSIGKYTHNQYTEIREILTPSHPCKRDNLDEPVFGLFATQDLPKKLIIGEYKGLVCTQDEYEADIGHFERYDGQWRTFEFKTHSAKESSANCNLLVNASYYSNETVFVNDERDSLYGKWNDHNISFFEICINGWPHAFFRVFMDVKKGEELLTSYGSNFWKHFDNERNISNELNKYYLHRLEREKEANMHKKRKRNVFEMENEENNNVNAMEFVEKRRKICKDSVIHSMDTKIVQCLQRMENDGERVMVLLKQKDELIRRLQAQNRKNKNRLSGYAKIRKGIPAIIQKVKDLQREKEESEKRNRELMKELTEIKFKKKKYKDKCRLLLLGDRQQMDPI